MKLDAITIRQVVSKIFTDKRYAVHHEVGILKHGSLRADLVATNTKPYIVICEIKSSVADFKSDLKWHKYLPSCNQFYFAMTDLVWAKVQHLIPKGVGTFVVNSETLHVTLKGGSTKRKVEVGRVIDVLSRCSYRAASVKLHLRKNESNGAKTVAQLVTDSVVGIKSNGARFLAVYKTLRPYI